MELWSQLLLKNVRTMKIRKYSIFTQKGKIFLMQRDLSWTLHLATKGNFFLLFYLESKEKILCTLTATLFHNFQNIFQTLDREQRKLLFTRFKSESIVPSLALETGTMNNNLIINRTSFQLLLLVVAKILRRWLDTKLWWERIFFPYSINPYQCPKRPETDWFHPSFL